MYLAFTRHHQSPIYLSELLHLYTPSRQLRSSADTQVFRIPSSRIRSSGLRSFSYQAPTTWNQLPVSATVSWQQTTRCCHRVSLLSPRLGNKLLAFATVSRCYHSVLGTNSSLLPPCLAVVTVSGQQTHQCCQYASHVTHAHRLGVTGRCPPHTPKVLTTRTSPTSSLFP